MGSSFSRELGSGFDLEAQQTIGETNCSRQRRSFFTPLVDPLSSTTMSDSDRYVRLLSDIAKDVLGRPPKTDITGSTLKSKDDKNSNTSTSKDLSDMNATDKIPTSLSSNSQDHPTTDELFGNSNETFNTDQLFGGSDHDAKNIMTTFRNDFQSAHCWELCKGNTKTANEYNEYVKDANQCIEKVECFLKLLTEHDDIMQRLKQNIEIYKKEADNIKSTIEILDFFLKEMKILLNIS